MDRSGPPTSWTRAFDDPRRFAEIWPGAEFAALQPGPFDAVVRRRTLPRTVLEGISADPFTCLRTPRMVEEHPNDLLAINAVLLGEITMRGAGVEFTAHPGDVFLQRGAAFEFTTPVLSRTFRALVPMGLVAPAVMADHRPFLLAPRSVLTAAFLRLAEEVLATSSMPPALLTRGEAPLEHALLVLEEALVDEVLEHETHALPPSRALRLRALIAMERGLADPGTTPERTARALGVSRRTLYAAFEHEPETPARTLRRMRVESATALLRADPDLPASLLARRSGFASRDSFARAFREHHERGFAEYRERLVAAS